MRRLLLVMVLLATGVAVLPAGARPVRLPYRVPGSVVVEHADTPRAWLEEQYQHLAGLGDVAKQVLARYDRAMAAQAETIEWEGVYETGDLDGDGVFELMKYHTRAEIDTFTIEGWTDLDVYSGRTGARRWGMFLADAPMVFPTPLRVGRDEPGLLVVRPFAESSDDTGMRLLGLSGRTGKTVYDKTVRTGDGLGSIQFGGLFDAYPRGGTDILIGRTRRYAAPATLEGQALWESEPYVLDGADGTIRRAHRTVLEIGAGVRYLAVGDVDADRRDDFLRVRREFRDTGTVTALGVVEDEVHWEQSDVPVGRVLFAEWANMSGGKGEDVLLNTWTWEVGLLEIPGVTDGLPLLDGPDRGVHAVLFDGDNGTKRFERMEGEFGFHMPWDDVSGDGRVDLLVTSVLHGSKDGVVIRVIDAAGRQVRRRDVTITPPPARTELGAGTFALGDLDGDKIVDIGYVVESASVAERRSARGFLLLGQNRLHATPDEPFYGTLDGGTDERVHLVIGDGRMTFTAADGWRGAALWTVSVSTKAKTWAWLGSHTGARGRCAGALLYGGTVDGKSYWLDVLDGSTGRVRWSRTFKGSRPDGTRPSRSGRTVACR